MLGIDLGEFDRATVELGVKGDALTGGGAGQRRTQRDRSRGRRSGVRQAVDDERRRCRRRWSIAAAAGDRKQQAGQDGGKKPDAHARSPGSVTASIIASVSCALVRATRGGAEERRPVRQAIQKWRGPGVSRRRGPAAPCLDPRMAAVSSSLPAGQADPQREDLPRPRRIGNSAEPPRHRRVPFGHPNRRGLLTVTSKLLRRAGRFIRIIT